MFPCANLPYVGDAANVEILSECELLQAARQSDDAGLVLVLLQELEARLVAAPHDAGGEQSEKRGPHCLFGDGDTSLVLETDIRYTLRYTQHIHTVV